MPIQIHGKTYFTVAERIQEFHEKFPDGSITTEIINTSDQELIRVKASVHLDGRLFTGHAEEVRGSTQINKTNPLENCESSAVGRALAFLGLGADESIASADEVANALSKQNLIQRDEAPFRDDEPPIEVTVGLKVCPKCKKEHDGRYPKCLECWKAEQPKK